MTSKEDELPIGLGFGTLLGWLMSRGIRPPASPRQGERWTREDFGDHINRSERQVRNWLKEESLPNLDDSIVLTIERVLFGTNRSYRADWRAELHDALRRSRTGSKQKIEVETRQAVATYLNHAEQSDRDRAYNFLCKVADSLDHVASVWREVAHAVTSPEELNDAHISHIISGQYSSFQYIRRFSEDARSMSFFRGKGNIELFMLIDSAVIQKGHLLSVLEQSSISYTGIEQSSMDYDINGLVEHRREERQKHISILNNPTVSDVDKILARREINFGVDPDELRSKLYEDRWRKERMQRAARNDRLPFIKKEIVSGSGRLSILAGAFRASVDIYGMA